MTRLLTARAGLYFDSREGAKTRREGLARSGAEDAEMLFFGAKRLIPLKPCGGEPLSRRGILSALFVPLRENIFAFSRLRVKNFVATPPPAPEVRQ